MKKSLHIKQCFRSVYVEAGTADTEMPGTEYRSTSLILHSDYDERTYGNDFGIIKIGNDMELNGNTMKAVKLADKNIDLKAGTKIRLSGWGVTSEGSNKTSRYLLAVETPIISQDQWKESYDFLTSHQFCAGDEQGGKDACQGDSGGPAVLVTNGTLVGVISFGSGCGRKDYPGVYGNVAKVRDFIRKNCNV